MMALRHRLTLLAAGTAGLTVVLVSIAAFFCLVMSPKKQAMLPSGSGSIRTRYQQSHRA